MSQNGNKDTKRVLIIEDEPDLIRGLKDAMTFEGFDVVAAQNGKLGLSAARYKEVDLILLDLMLPDMNGFYVCEQIRAFNSRVPIIMLTARGQEADKIRGLEAGADDYVTKPFSVGELLARIHAMFRRFDRVDANQTVQIGESVIDLQAQELKNTKGVSSLSFYEVELFKLLHSRVGQVVDRDEILEQIWGLEPNHSNRTVDNCIVKLRKKLEDDPKAPKHILTIYGQGYKLIP